MKSIRDYGAKGDGVTDDTAAIQRALDEGRRDGAGNPLFPRPDELNGRPKALFFPAGTYLVSGTLDWFGCCMTLQGAGSSSTVFRLKPGAAGFTDPQNPKPVIRTENGNMSFRQNIFDLGITIGSGNAGAVGIDYVSNNSGSMRNVAIRSEDGAGVAGIDMTRNWPGPAMLKRVSVSGFNVGMRIQYIEYSMTLEDIVLTGQKVAGIRNDGAVMAIRGLYSSNDVPAIVSGDLGFITLIDARLEGGSAARAAVEFDSGKGTAVHARNISTAGYRAALKNGSTETASPVTEYLSQTPLSLFGSGTLKPLNLPVKNTPAHHDADLTQWAAVTANGYTGPPLIDQVQPALNSGKSTVYFPFGVRQVYFELPVTVPATVKRIHGFMSVFNGGDPVTGGGIRFIVEGDSPEPLVIEQMGYGVRVEHRGKRPVVLKNGIFTYISQAGAGDVYAEDVQLDGFTVQAGQKMWGRQINNELRTATKIVNLGGQLWIMGMKTEGQQTVIDARGGSTEYLGGLLYPATGDMRPGEIAFKLANGTQGSFLYSNIVYTTRNYDVQVQETRGNETRTMTTQQSPGRTRFYVSGL